MQTVFSERRHYREYKTELSPDFSDVRAKVRAAAVAHLANGFSDSAFVCACVRCVCVCVCL